MFKKTIHNQAGYTATELLMVATILCIFAFVATILTIVTTGNFWYTETGVLKELQANNPRITEITATGTSIISKSLILVVEDGQPHKYCLDTNMLWNYQFSDCQ